MCNYVKKRQQNKKCQRKEVDCGQSLFWWIVSAANVETALFVNRERTLRPRKWTTKNYEWVCPPNVLKSLFHVLINSSFDLLYLNLEQWSWFFFIQKPSYESKSSSSRHLQYMSCPNAHQKLSWKIAHMYCSLCSIISSIILCGRTTNTKSWPFYHQTEDNCYVPFAWFTLPRISTSFLFP